MTETDFWRKLALDNGAKLYAEIERRRADRARYRAAMLRVMAWAKSLGLREELLRVLKD